MASAGRILIIPRGIYDPTKEYEMLDLVFHNGTSWLAKKSSVGVEPSDANSEYWFKMCEATDLSTINNRLQQLESQMLSTISLDDIDLSEYAKASDVESLSNDVGALDSKVETLETAVSGLQGGGFTQAEIVTRKGTGASTENYPASVEFSFAPDVVIILGGISSITNVWRAAQGDSTIVCNLLTTEFQKSLGFYNGGNTETTNYSFAKKSEDGKTIYWYQTQNTQNANCHFNAADTTYTLLAIKCK